MNKILLLLALAGFYLSVYSQGEANNWYFGALAGVTFNGGTPVALTNGALNTAEGSATISDKNGNLLFYTDGIRVWDRNHNQMPNGIGLLGDPSSAQSAIIVPRPGNPNRFFIFTVAAQGNPGGFCYSEVDMTLNAGFGDVLAVNKNTQLFTPSVEKCAAVRHANGLYYWAIGHGFNNNRYYAYLIDCNGVQNPVITDVGSVEGWPGWGYLTPSSDGLKLGSAMRAVGFEVLDFNNATGVVSNPINLGQATDCYGISFSPNNQVLYGLQISTGNIYQWNLQAGTPAAIIASAQNVGTAPGTGTPYRGGALQLGPDGKIYMPHYAQPFLAAINNPNVIGAGCGYQPNAVDLLGRSAILGLPPFIQNYFNTTETISFGTDSCSGTALPFTISSNAAILDSVKWNFGDAASGAANFSSLINPTHTYANAGTYNVQLIRFVGCVSDTTVQPITIINCPGTPVGGVINIYTPVTAIDPCTNSVTVGSSTGFGVGDRVLLIQMKGASIDQTNTAAFGNVTNYNNAGNYEMATVASVNGNNIQFVNTILRSYTISGAVQLVRVPQYTDVLVTSPITCPAWNGSIGGIIAMEASGTVTLNADVDASNLGFRAGVVSLNMAYTCNQQDYFYDITSQYGGRKGEGIFELPTNIINGRGKNANGGGGGNDTNSGGAGGGNGGTGGRGGNQWGGCPSIPIGGDGGLNLVYSNANNKIFLGGGAGGGHQNDATATPGTNGAGIVFIKSAQLATNGGAIKAFTQNAIASSTDGSGGAGGAGTVLLSANNFIGNLTIDVHGGNGGGNNGHGPGGGGGGGVVWSTNALPGNVTVINTGGQPGIATNYGNSYGAGAGQNGITLQGLSIPESNTIFNPVDTPQLSSNAPICAGATLQLNASGNYLPGSTFSWSGPNGFASVQQNATLQNSTTLASGTYTVTVTENNCTAAQSISAAINPTYQFTINPTICPNDLYQLPDGNNVSVGGTYQVNLTSSTGCDSSYTVNLTIVNPTINAGSDVAICLGDSTPLQASGGLFTYSWTPSAGLSDTSVANPIAYPASTTTYVVTSQTASSDLIMNGNFESGNVGFSSSYTYDANLLPAGNYYIGNNPNTYHSSFSPCPDHTTGTGNMMIVNGAGTANTTVWCQSISVVPNTDYAFSCWGISVTGGSPAILQFSINGGLLGSPFNLTTTVCQWQQFYTVWNSGSNTTANICIVNQNTTGGGNDFALDDVSFVGLCNVTDTVVVTVSPVYHTVIDTAICQGNTYTFPGGNTSTVNISDTALLQTFFGCDSVVVTHLTVNPSPITNVYDTVCANQTYTLPDGSSVNTTGVYTDTLATFLGCDSIVVTYLTVHPIYAATVLDTICNGSTYTLPDGSIVSNSGIYTVVLSTTDGCDSTIQTQLTVLNPVLTSTITDVLCNGDNTGAILANATGGLAPYAYSLLQGSNPIAANTTGQFTNLSAGAYTISITDAFGCSTTANTTINEPSLLVSSFSLEMVSCYGLSDGQVTVTSNGGVAPYTYQFSNASNNNNGVFSGLSAGNYSYTVTDANGCTDGASVQISEPNAVTLSVNPAPALVQLGEELPLNASSNYSNAQFYWTPALGLSCYNCPAPIFAYNFTMQYHVQAVVDINGNLCEAGTVYEVTVIPNYDIFIPNVFSPNNDGQNDYFEYYGNKAAVKYIEVMIFNRTGEKVFESNDIYFKWNGSYKGAPLEPQVLVYTMQIVFANNHAKELYKGSLTLMK